MTVQLDLALLDELSEVMGDDMSMLVSSYFTDSASKIQSLLEMDLTTEQDDIYKLAHNLKGSSRNLGAIELADYFAKIEKLARADNLTAVDFKPELINALFQSTRQTLSNKFL
ncbi:MAG: Hpt domain-containing protein [Kangiellaceae bacterium]|nr:Hpt domain-containing protein [Kangiellaceae bacterium]